MKKVADALNEISPMGEIVLIDIGARWGIQGPWKNIPVGALRYYGFDADEAECRLLNETKQLSGKAKYLPYALSDKIGEEKFYLTETEGASSFYKPNYSIANRYYFNEYYKIKKELILKTTTLQKVFADEKIDPDFMKIDTQGFELNILKGAGEYLDDVLAMEIEVEFLPFYEGQPLFSDVDSFARAKGFELFDLNRYWGKRVNMAKDQANRGQIAFADAIYFRSAGSFYALYKNSDKKKEKLMKIVSMFVLYGFFDAAIEYIKHPDSPLTGPEINLIERVCLELSAYPKWQKMLFNNRLATSAGKWLSYLGSMLSYRMKTYGWGTDYNAVDGRYLYYLNGRVSGYFRK